MTSRLFSMGISTIQLNFGTVRCSTDNNIYDVLRLIYRLCASEHDDMQVGVKCLDHYMGGNGGEMADSAKRCMQLREGDSPDPVSEMCSRYTDISEWQAKNKLPPPSLTGSRLVVVFAVPLFRHTNLLLERVSSYTPDRS
ncbi:uncharacterized protein ISCGN_032616 [Ixodes scapularis]